MIEVFLKFDHKLKERKRDEIYDWIKSSSLKKSFVGSSWYYSGVFGMIFYFRIREDAALFKLTWG